MRRRSWAVAVCMSVLVGCGGGSASDDGGGRDGGGVSAGNGGPDELFAETASFEVVAGTPQRLMVGLSTKDQRVLAGGTVTFTLKPAVESDAAPEPVIAKATFLSVPAMPAVDGDARIGRPSTGVGVYSTTVTLPESGIWTIEVKPNGPLSKRTAQTAVEVLSEPQVPAVGQLAPLTKNLTLTTPGVEQKWLDSGASPEFPADPLLHSTVIADAIAAERPLVIVVSTPAFCVSRFCGPVTELVRTRAEKMAADPKAPAFVHLEVWREFEKAVVNKGAADWILANGAEGREPWIFVVGRDGRITARFDNVIDEAALDAAIAAL